MPEAKLTKENVKTISQLLNEDYNAKDLAQKYGVNRSLIYQRAKYPYQARTIPLEVKNNVIMKIKKGYTKAEAAQKYEVPISTVLSFTKRMNRYKFAGNHIIRKNRIELLNRLMKDGCIISDFVVSTVRGLRQHFPMICYARFEDKGMFYLEDKNKKALQSVLDRSKSRIVSYQEFGRMLQIFNIKVDNDEKKAFLGKKMRGQKPKMMESLVRH